MDDPFPYIQAALWQPKISPQMNKRNKTAAEWYFTILFLKCKHFCQKNAHFAKRAPYFEFLVNIRGFAGAS